MAKAELPSKKSTLEKHRMLLSKVNEATMSVKTEDILNSDDFQRACKNLIKVVYNHIALGKEENLPKTVPPCSQEEKVLVACRQAESDEQRVKNFIKRIAESSGKKENEGEYQKQSEKKLDFDFVNNYLEQPDFIDTPSDNGEPAPTSITVPARKIAIRVKRPSKQQHKKIESKNGEESLVVDALLKRFKRALQEEVEKEQGSHSLVEITNGSPLAANSLSSGKDRSIPKIKRTLLNDSARSTPFLPGERHYSEAGEEEVQ